VASSLQRSHHDQPSQRQRQQRQQTLCTSGSTQQPEATSSAADLWPGRLLRGTAWHGCCRDTVTPTGRAGRPTVVTSTTYWYLSPLTPPAPPPPRPPATTRAYMPGAAGARRRLRVGVAPPAGPTRPTSRSHCGTATGGTGLVTLVCQWHWPPGSREKRNGTTNWTSTSATARLPRPRARLELRRSACGARMLSVLPLWKCHVFKSSSLGRPL